MICIVTYLIGCLFQLYAYMLFYYRQSNSHGLLATIVCVIIGLRTHFILRTCLPRITHILFSWTVSIVLPNHTQFIPVNRMLYIAHAFIWLPVSLCLLITNNSLSWTVCPASHTQLNSEPCLMHLSSQMFCTFFDGFFTPPFAIMAPHTVSSQVRWS